MKRVLVTVLAAVAAVCLPTAGASGSSAADLSGGPTRATTSAAEALDAQLAQEPGGRVVGNRIFYPDGAVFVDVDAGTLSIGQCAAGQFCLWSFSNYTGSFSYKTGSGVTRTITTSVGSFYNNRSAAARLYSNTGASSTCYAAGAQRATVTSSYSSPAKVYLSATTSC